MKNINTKDQLWLNGSIDLWNLLYLTKSARLLLYFNQCVFFFLSCHWELDATNIAGPLLLTMLCL